MLLVFPPTFVSAGIFSALVNLDNIFDKKENNTAVSHLNSQNVPLLQGERGFDMGFGKGGGDITVVGGTALMPESGPVGTMVDVEDGATNGTISTYVVRKGDTISTIAKMFGVTASTVIWANDIKNSVIREGQVLVILPISGVRHTVVKGETISSIAKKYKADVDEIIIYNGLSANQTLSPGYIVIVPDGEIASPSTRATASNPLRGGSGPSYEGYYLRPILAGKRSQGLHGYNGIDLATYLGAPVFASAEGDVIVSARGGWNGGYGKYIVIAHSNGTQTLYAHLNDNFVSVGDHVVRGQQIGQVGSTGKSTGPHIHFEVRGAKNPF